MVPPLRRTAGFFRADYSALPAGAASRDGDYLLLRRLQYPVPGDQPLALYLGQLAGADRALDLVADDRA